MNNPVNDLLLQPASTPPPDRIARFDGMWRFLSNFHYCPVTIRGYTYPTAEHAYQAAKARNRDDWERVMRCKTPGEAKRAGREIRMMDGWEDGDPPMKVEQMMTVLRAKFSTPWMRDLLLLTGEAELIEGNDWGDQYWGVYRGQGKNMLGVLLMLVRLEIQDEIQGGH